MPGKTRLLACVFLFESIAQASTLTQPDTSTILKRIAFGSCAFQSVEQPIFRTLAEAAPDVYLSLGDAIYADYDTSSKSVYPVTPETLHREWQVLADSADWQYLVERVPVVATWDNHDYGHHRAGEEFALKKESGEIFLDFFSEPVDSQRRQRPGIYDAKIFGPENQRVQLILLDTRTFKSEPVLAERRAGVGGSLGKYAPNTDTGASLLGADQWTWLEEQLQRPAAIRLLVSSGQIIADQKGMDEWGNYPLERQRIFNLLAHTAATAVLMLSGNVHFSEVSQINLGEYSLVDFTSSGLTHVNKSYASAENPYRVTGPYAEVNFGLIEIDWDAVEGPLITLSVVGLEGQKAFEYQPPPRSGH